MIALVEGANRQKTPNEIALNILLAALTILLLLAVATLQPLAIYSKQVQAAAPDSSVITGHGVTGIVLVSLLVCLIPTTIGALLSAIGIAGIARLVQRNVLAVSGRAVEAAGDVNTLLLDKTGTITLGNRQASEFLPVGDTDESELADAAQLSSLADETPEGRSVVVLAKKRYGLRARQPGELAAATWVPFSAQTRMSGVDLPTRRTDGGLRVRKGAAAAVLTWVRENGGGPTNGVGPIVDGISAAGGTPLVVAEQRHGESARALGVIHLKDVVKTGMRERFDEMRRMGIRTVMITGDNPLTARAIADEAGVDDFLAEATPEDKMAFDQGRASRRQARCDDGRRHQRCPRPCAGRCWRRHEHGHVCGQGSRKHGRPRLRPHQVDRNRGDRQAVVDHPRGADDLLYRERHRQVLRDHPCHVRRGLPQPRSAQHHAVAQPGNGDPFRRDLQRADHRGARSARPPRRTVRPGRRQRTAAAQLERLWAGWHRRPVHRNQDHRLAHLNDSRDIVMRLPPWLAQHLAALRALLMFTVVLGLAYPLAITTVAQLPGLQSRAHGSLLTGPASSTSAGSRLIGQAFLDKDGNALVQYFQSRASAAGDGYDPTSTSASNLGPEDIVDTFPDPKAPPGSDEAAGSLSLLSQVCARSKAVGTLEQVDGRRPFCTEDGAGAVLAVFHQDGLAGPFTRAISLNQACPAKPFVATWDGVSVECARSGEDYSHGVITPVRGTAPAVPAVPADAVTASGSGLDPHISPAYAQLQIARVAKARGMTVADLRAVVDAHTSGRTLGFLGEPTVNVLELNLDLDRRYRYQG
jgi:K+-transporting ATPase c subunit